MNDRCDDQGIWQYVAGVESNARTYARTFSKVFERGAGARMWDTDGVGYLDFLACAGSLPLGHNPPAVTDKVVNFVTSGHVLQALDMTTKPKYEFVRTLLDCLPEEFRVTARLQFCGPSGADAVEASMKLFKTATGRRSIIAFNGAYHGMTLGALGLTGNLAPKQNISGMAGEVHFFPYPNPARCSYGLSGSDSVQVALTHLERTLEDPESGITTPAMIILEPVQGEGGCIPAPDEWLRGVRKIADRFDIPLVVDEIQTGFGRTGRMFAHEHAGIVPDAILMSKAVGGGFPLSVIAYNKKFDKWMPGAHAGTFRGNQIAFVAGAETIKIIKELGLPKRALENGRILLDGLLKLKSKYDFIGDVRGRGLMCGMEIVDPNISQTGNNFNGDLAKKLKGICFTKGLILETGGRFGAVVRFLPPLTVTDDEIRLALTILDRSLSEAQESYQMSQVSEGV